MTLKLKSKRPEQRSLMEIVLHATGQTRQRAGEDRQEFLWRVAKAITDRVHRWLPDYAKAWYASVVKAHENDEPLPDFDDDVHPDDEPVLNVVAAKNWPDRWTRFHHALIGSPPKNGKPERQSISAFTTLTLPALQVMLYLLTQFDGRNNGELEVTLARMQRYYGWGNSPQTFSRAVKMLIGRQLVRAKERIGTRPAQYTITWLKNRVREDDE